MLGTVILLQLTLWVASIHAFYPLIPPWQCQEENNCAADSKSEKPKARDVHTYQLSQRVRDVCDFESCYSRNMLFADQGAAVL